VRRQGYALDAAGAVVAFGATLAMLAVRGLGTPDPHTTALDATGVLLAALSTLPFAARRLAVGAVYAVVAAASLALLHLRYGLDAPIGVVAAGYALAVARSGDPRPARRLGVLVAIAAFIPLVAVAYVTAGVALWPISPALLIWALLFAVLWFAGDRTQLRRAQLEELRERARRAEREADGERRLAASQERIRIARELHDSAGHAISVILVQAGAARLLHGRDPAGSLHSIATIEDVARATIGEIDALVRALREDERDDPPAPADPAAFEELWQRHRHAGVPIDAEVRGERPVLPHGVARAGYRILQEALTNAVRHGCGPIHLVLAFQSDAVEVTVTNGIAPASGGFRGDGHGITGMRERAAVLGGTLVTVPGRERFRLHARLPIADPAQARP
jgi:signal transduction histidine kinase